MAHRTYEGAALQVLLQILLRLLRADEDDLLRAELDGGHLAAGAQQQDAQVLGRGAPEQPRLRPLKQAAVGIELYA